MVLKALLVIVVFKDLFQSRCLVANLITTISTGKSHLISCTLGIQSIEQVKKEYGEEQAEIIAGICANILCGQVSGDSVKKLLETFGKIVQDRQSLSINSSDTSVSKSTQMDYAVPASKIATLSSGEFVGLVADSPGMKIPQKLFHAELQNDHEGIKLEEEDYEDIQVIRRVSAEDVRENYLRIKREVVQLVRRELEKLPLAFSQNDAIADNAMGFTKEVKQRKGRKNSQRLSM